MTGPSAGPMMLERLTEQLNQQYQGPSKLFEALLVALLARGHVLLEGVPGVAKTTVAKGFSVVLGCRFNRIQFTPDLLPADITGTTIYDQRSSEFETRLGPIFANVVLGDEINRAPAKTQSALLEAMQEGQVTLDGKTHKLPELFMVIATQNPIEQSGVYQLPEAQMDRFLMKLKMTYPKLRDEVRMLTMNHGGAKGSNHVSLQMSCSSATPSRRCACFDGGVHVYCVVVSSHPPISTCEAWRRVLAQV